MMEFTSLFDDAGASAEAEQADRALETAKVASSGLFEFCALAKDAGEFEGRLALALDQISTHAVQAGATPTALEDSFRRQFGLLLQARKTAGCDECERADSGVCGTHKEAGQESLQDYGKVHQGTTYSGYAGDPEPDERTAHERYGDTGDYYAGGDDGDAQDEHYGRDGRDGLHSDYDRNDFHPGYYASIKQALEEGQDPLLWLEQEGGGEGVAEKPVEAGIEATEGTTASRHPFAREADGLFGRQPAAPAADPLEGRAQCPCGQRTTAPFGDGSGQHKCYSCDGVFTPRQADQYGMAAQAKRVTASGLGMPEGGMLSGAPTAGSVSDVNVPQQPQGFGGMPMTPPVPTNQSTTKPRQMPGGNESGPMDPASSGAEGGEGAPANADTLPSANARRAFNQRVAAVARTIREDNPQVPRREAREMAMQVVRDYGLVSEAEWSALNFGNTSDVADGPWTKKVKQWEPPDPTDAPKPQVSDEQEESAPHVDTNQGLGHGPLHMLPKLPEIGEAGEAAAGAARLLPLLAL